MTNTDQLSIYVDNITVLPKKKKKINNQKLNYLLKNSILLKLHYFNLYYIKNKKIYKKRNPKSFYQTNNNQWQLASNKYSHQSYIT